MCAQCDEWVAAYRKKWPSGKPGHSTAKRGRHGRITETWSFLLMVRRMIAAAGKRVALSDEIELGALIEMHKDLDAAIQVAVDGMRERGMTWEYIGSSVKIKRSAAQERWGGDGDA